MLRYTAIIAILAVALTACQKEEEPEEEVAPPPTPQEIAAGIIQKAGLNSPQPKPDLLQVLQQEKNANVGSQDGKDALLIVSHKVDERIRAAEDMKSWQAVLQYVKASKILRPETKRYDALEKRAVTELKRPEVDLKAFFDVGNGQTVAILEFYLPLEGETVSERMRPGEEAYGLKLAQILGNNSGVRMEYLETGETYDIFLR